MMSQRLVSGQLLTSKMVSQMENRQIVLVLKLSVWAITYLYYIILLFIIIIIYFICIIT